MRGFRQSASVARAFFSRSRVRWPWYSSIIRTEVPETWATFGVSMPVCARSVTVLWRKVYIVVPVERATAVTASLTGCFQASLFHVCPSARWKIGAVPGRSLQSSSKSLAVVCGRAMRRPWPVLSLPMERVWRRGSY